MRIDGDGIESCLVLVCWPGRDPASRVTWDDSGSVQLSWASAKILPAHQTGQSMFARRLAVAIAVLAGLIGSQGPDLHNSTTRTWAARSKRSTGPIMRLYVVAKTFDPEIARQPRSRITNRLSRCRLAPSTARWSWCALGMGRDAPHRMAVSAAAPALAPRVRKSRAANRRIGRRDCSGRPASNLRELDHPGVGGDCRRGHACKREGVAMRVGDRQAG